ncbi:MAG: redoxin domain-containing protein [Halobacteriales archaeon]|nr:redoxin domain-containing protein [Halobacteriales archaeon]
MDLGFDIVDLPPADPPAVGETAPDLTRPLVTAEYWQDVALGELTAEGPVLVVFHPMDGAFPTTYAWKEIAGRGWGDRLRVVGVSVSDPYAHKQLIRERGLEDGDYALYSDPQNGLAEAFGVTHDLDGMAGVVEARPAAFLLDGDHTVRYAWAASQWPEFPDYDAVEAAIDELVGGA